MIPVPSNTRVWLAAGVTDSVLAQPPPFLARRAAPAFWAATTADEQREALSEWGRAVTGRAAAD